MFILQIYVVVLVRLDLTVFLLVIVSCPNLKVQKVLL